MYLSSPQDQQSTPIDPPADTPAIALPFWRRAPRLGGIAAVLVAALLAYVGFQALGGSAAKADAPPAPTVTVAQPIQRNVVEWDDYSGRFEAVQSVEIKPRVSGQLQSVHFRDGETVRAGQLLFTIDQRPFLAALNEARARAQAARTALTLAQSEFARASALTDDEAVSREEVDTRRAAVASAQAQVAAADAVVQQRALDLDFTRIRAPLTGRISDRRVHPGNLVVANESMLTTVMSLDPIHFVFDGSEALYLRSLRNREANGPSAQDVEIRLQDEADYNWRGRVDFTDNAIAADSGTMRGRAVIANPNGFLAPGMFGNMRLSAGGQRAALLVPDAAVLNDQARKIVLVVAANGTVEARPVQIGARIGTLRTIRSGLRPSDRVVVEGVQMAQPGASVNVRATRIQAPAPQQAAQAAATPDRAPAASQATLAN
jgi:RND family efflux transporter MFP subunit